MDKGVVIKAYQADDQVFRSNKWQKVCRDERHQLTFAGVNVNFKNGIVEKRRRDLRDLTQTELI